MDDQTEGIAGCARIYLAWSSRLFMFNRGKRSPRKKLRDIEIESLLMRCDQFG
ncbi:unnamed protein product [Eruca vesicaria subsp. sativa]|uniref:Uncharacterized protein n=1 Tax=Eruca vesicaria subsp. sativa TaxID=29727 RepID=A0ABC8JSG0_ERUVS|nr:unnamed protein product [Eruca vesicaria subsp. sativa]